MATVGKALELVAESIKYSAQGVPEEDLADYRQGLAHIAGALGYAFGKYFPNDLQSLKLAMDNLDKERQPHLYN